MALFVFRHFLVHLYQWYLRLTRKIREAWRPSKNRLIYPLSSRYVIHVIVIGLMMLVTTNNIWARNITGDTVGKDSILYAVVGGEQGEEIIETADSQIIQAPSALEQGGALLAQQAETGSDVGVEADTSPITEGGALIKNNPAETTAVTTRDEVTKYTVKDGETISQIADNFGVSAATILHENDMRDTDIIKPGQELRILPFSGVSHKVASGQTLESIAKKYEVELNEVLEYNKLVSADDISEGQLLLIPNAAIPEPPAPTPAPAPKRTLVQAVSDFFRAPETPKDTTGGWGWPAARRKINQYPRLGHIAADIDAETGDPIRASQSGTVVTVGWGGGYGKHVVINHGGGNSTLYAHLSAYAVQQGQHVDKGQVIAQAGNTGWSTGPHLHFELILGGRKVNPLSYVK